MKEWIIKYIDDVAEMSVIFLRSIETIEVFEFKENDEELKLLYTLNVQSN